jgi:hypothetical protein
LKHKIVAIVAVLAVAVMATGCASTGLSQTGQQGAGIGAVIGGLTGALVDHRNPWRGGVIGAVGGAVVMGTVGELSYRGAREAAQTGQPVQYRTDNGYGMYQATPGPMDPVTRCRKVHERIMDGDRVVRDQTREVCTGTQTTVGY